MIGLTYSKDIIHQERRENFNICHRKNVRIQNSSLFRDLENGGHIEFFSVDP
jgi:hypothetical protein